MSAPLIEFQDVTKIFDNRTVLDKVNLKIYDGEVSTIIGKSGTGKSVLLKHIIGLLTPSNGRILFRGKPLHEMRRHEKEAFQSKFSYCFQNNALFDSLTVFENIALPIQQTTRLSKKSIERKVLEKMEQMELSDVPDKYPSEISGGMQKRAALARALVTDPKIVLFDEPTTGQDPIRKNAILSMIVQNQRKYGFTTIMVSHEIPDVFFISDRILVLYDGKIIFQGSYQDIDHLQHPIVDEFVQSLEGFKDELTGLYSKKGFKTAYEKNLKEEFSQEPMTVIAFSLNNPDVLNEHLGAIKTQEIIRSLGEIINKHFGQVGISTRIDSARIATILPHTDGAAVVHMLDRVSKDLHQNGLAGITAVPFAALNSETFSFSVSVGVADGKVWEDMETLSKKAVNNQDILAAFVVN